MDLVWIEEYLQQFAAAFAIDLLGYAILSYHFHLISELKEESYVAIGGRRLLNSFSAFSVPTVYFNYQAVAGIMCGTRPPITKS